MIPQSHTGNSHYNQVDYNIADQDRAVREVSHELVGITSEFFTKWYYDACETFYYHKVAHRAPLTLSQLPQAEFEISLSHYEQIAERYVAYCNSAIKREFEFYFNREINFLCQQHEYQKRRALDRRLYLARRVYAVAKGLYPALPLFLAAKAGDNWLSTDDFKFTPTHSVHGTPPYAAAKYLAQALCYQDLVIEFDEANKSLSDDLLPDSNKCPAQPDGPSNLEEEDWKVFELRTPRSKEVTERDSVQLDAKATPPKSAYTVTKLCAGDNEKQQREIADKLKGAWIDVCNTPRVKSGKSISSNTAAAAVFKVAEHLKKVKDVPRSTWREALQYDWGVEVTEGIAKYSFDFPKSNAFKEAVKMAFKYFESYPIWVKGKDLPDIYR